MICRLPLKALNGPKWSTTCWRTQLVKYGDSLFSCGGVRSACVGSGSWTSSAYSLGVM